MDSTLWVFVYSQYSPSCLKLMQLIDQSGLDITFQVLSIDDKTMRKRIKNDLRYNINYVPCILKIDKNSGVASQYEADRAFQLIQSEIQTKLPERLSERLPPTNIPTHQRKQPAQVTFEMIDPSPQTQPSTNPQQPHENQHVNPHVNPHPNQHANATPIEELMDLSELEDQQPSITGDRPMGERRTTEKISVANVMASREAIDMGNSNKPTQPEMDIKPVKTGQKINVNEIMASKS